MSRQIDGDGVESVMRKIARLQLPDAVVVRTTMDEHDGRLGRIERLAAGIGKSGLILDQKFHFFNGRKQGALRRNTSP